MTTGLRSWLDERPVAGRLLSGSDQMAAANALLKDILGEILVMGDPEAADGVSITLCSAAAQLLQCPQASVGKQKSAPWGAVLSGLRISVVAGTRNRRSLPRLLTMV